MSTGPSVHVVVPASIDDPELPSGGNVYDRRVCLGLTATGWSVHVLAVSGAWPRPDRAARAALARALATVPDRGVALVDGLVACAVPDVIVEATRRVALVVLVHLPLGDELGASARELAARERRTLRAVTSVVTTSQWSARRLREQHRLADERVHVAAPGVDPAPLAVGTDGASRLLCVGSITRTKGQDLLVEALSSVAASGPWRCELVGPLRRDPEHVSSVRRAIHRLRLDARVALTGPRTGSRLAETFEVADLLVLPSRVESYGMVVTEALARGIPVLAADTGGVREALGRDPDGRVPGVLVPPDDVPALAEALHRWLRQPGLRDRVRDAARKRRGTLHGWEVTSECMASVLETGRVLEGRR